MSIRQNVGIWVISFIALSCHNNGDIKSIDGNETPEVLRINFKENVYQVNPEEVNSQAEAFITDLIYQQLRLPNDSTNNGLITKWSFDSASSTITLSIDDQATYHNGRRFTASDFYELLKIRLRKNSDARFFQLIKGFALSEWYRNNRNVNDLMPEGIRISGDSAVLFDIQTTPDAFLAAFADLDPMIPRDSVYGTGSFLLTKHLDDIEVVLSRAKRSDQASDFENIQLTFLKSDTLILQNLLRGNIDMFEFNPSSMDSSYTRTYLEDQIVDEYPEHGVYIGNRCLVEYVEIQDVSDTLTAQWLIDSIKPLAYRWSASKNGVSMTESTTREVFHVVIENTDHTAEAVLQKLVASLPKSKLEKSLVAIVSIYPYYYLTRKDIVGIRDYQSLTDIVKTARFKKPNTF